MISLSLVPLLIMVALNSNLIIVELISEGHSLEIIIIIIIKQ